MLIVLSGQARSGKDTASKILEQLVGTTVPVESIAYADYLKEIIGKVFGLTQEHLYGDLKEKPITDLPIKSRSGVDTTHHWTPRKLFQYIGTDVFRRIDPDCWLNVVKREVLCNRDTKSYIITDARFQNEIDWVLESGGFHIHITRENRDFCSETTHESENALPEFEETDNVFIVDNCGTLEDLKFKLIEVLKTSRSDNGR